jgi:hypothetical protein
MLDTCEASSIGTVCVYLATGPSEAKVLTRCSRHWNGVTSRCQRSNALEAIVAMDGPIELEARMQRIEKMASASAPKLIKANAGSKTYDR